MKDEILNFKYGNCIIIGILIICLLLILSLIEKGIKVLDINRDEKLESMINQGRMLLKEQYYEALSAEKKLQVYWHPKDPIGAFIDECDSRIIAYQGEIEWDKSRPENQLKRSLSIGSSKLNLNLCSSISLDNGLKEKLNWHFNNRLI